MPFVRVVDYRIPVEERVRVAGFMNVDSRITNARFPNPPGRGEEEVEFFPCRLLKDQSVEEITKNLVKPMRHALLFDLITFGVEDQRKLEAVSKAPNRRGAPIPLAAFESAFRFGGELVYPILQGPSGKRELLLRSVPFGKKLPASGVGFLAVSSVLKLAERPMDSRIKVQA